jgi:hypothetical protein
MRLDAAMNRPAARAMSSGIVTFQAGETVTIMAESHSEERETERRRDDALRRALAMPPLVKPKRQGSVQRALTEIIQEARDVRAEIAAFRADRDGRSDP